MTDELPPDDPIGRLGAFFNQPRLFTYATMLLIAELAMAAYFVAASYNLFHNQTAPVTTDFVSFYAAGHLADAGTPALAYSQPAHFLAEQQVREPGIAYNYFFYPPVFLILCALLAYLPYVPAFLIFEGGTLALYLLVATRILGRPMRETLIPLLAFPIVFWNFGWGQNAFLTAAIFGGATLLVDRRPIVAGLLFGTICYKPHFGILIPIALGAGRHWRAFAAAAVSSIGITLGSVLLFGMQTWRDFFTALSGSHATFEAGIVKLWAFVTPFGAVLLAGGSPTLGYAIQVVATGAAIVFVGWVWWRNLSLEVRAAALVAATLLAVPLAIFYDLMLAAVAGAWLCRSPSCLPDGQRLLFAFGYVFLLNSTQFSERTRIPFGLLAVLALLACIVGRAVQEAQAAQR